MSLIFLGTNFIAPKSGHHYKILPVLGHAATSISGNCTNIRDCCDRSFNPRALGFCLYWIYSCLTCIGGLNAPLHLTKNAPVSSLSILKSFIHWSPKTFKSSVCYFLFFHQMIALHNLRKMFCFIWKALSFSRYSNFYIFSLPFHTFEIQIRINGIPTNMQWNKGQMKSE